MERDAASDKQRIKVQINSKNEEAKGQKEKSQQKERNEYIDTTLHDSKPDTLTVIGSQPSVMSARHLVQKQAVLRYLKDQKRKLREED